MHRLPARTSRTRPIGLAVSASALALALSSAPVLLASTSAQASTHRTAAHPALQARAFAACSKLQGAVDSISGTKVKLETGSSSLYPTKLGQGSVALCIYGAMPALIELANYTFAKAITAAQAQQAVNGAIAKSTAGGVHFQVSPYPGLGFTAYQIHISEGGFAINGVEGYAGNHAFGAVAFLKIATSKLGALCKLAQGL